MTDLLCPNCKTKVEYAYGMSKDPVTGVVSCWHDSSVSGGDKLSKLRAENRAKTMDAMGRAKQAQARDAATNPGVVLNPIDKPGNRSQFGSQPLTVPKSVIESLNQKGEKYHPENNN